MRIGSKIQLTQAEFNAKKLSGELLIEAEYWLTDTKLAIYVDGDGDDYIMNAASTPSPHALGDVVEKAADAATSAAWIKLDGSVPTAEQAANVTIQPYITDNGNLINTYTRYTADDGTLAHIILYKYLYIGI